MPIFYRKTNILDPYSWALGSGSYGSFSQNGSTDENERVIGTDPFGNSSVLWETRANGTAADDGGWNHSSFSTDNTKLYRMSVWVKRTSSSAGGTFYLGTNGGGQCVLRLDGSYGEECNPYWECKGTGSYTQNVWYLVVGHVFPHFYPHSNQHADTGVWVIGSGKVQGINGCNIGNDLKFGPSTTTLNHRTYHFYCGDNTTRLQFFEPRVDLCDGSEPTISDLLNNRQAKLESATVTVEGAALKQQKIVATGGVITTVGEYRVHRFNDSGTFTLSSLRSGSIEVEYLIVAGGGGGGMDMGGGGGGGGVLNGTTILTPTSYTITVGGGGTGAPAGSTNGQPGGHQFTIGATAGSASSFNGLTANGGGFGASSYYGYTPNYGTPGNGGCGGGPSGYSDGGTRAGGTGNQGFNGGGGGGQYYSGGGGGAGAVGASSTGQPNGGAGKLVTTFGRPFYWAGGGGGASYSLGTGGNGGIGGGGGGALGTTTGGQSTLGGGGGQPGGGGSSGTWANTPGGDGGTNSGGGGGGGSHYNANNKGGNGGKGIVIIRYKYR